jgi:hypothetical protein
MMFAKWNRDGAVSLRDAMFLSHAKPRDGVRGFTRAARMAAADAPVGAASEKVKTPEETKDGAEEKTKEEKPKK